MKPSITQPLHYLFFIFAICISSVSCANDTDEKVVIDTEDEISDPITHGKEAHKNHCYKCHTDEIYTRDNRFVKSIDALSQQVVRCKDGSDVPWFDEDADAVVQFLNKKYYRF
jgi:spore coat polysaccharide biosynthesis protein SpsF (cytidylyltransferase family)